VIDTKRLRERIDESGYKLRYIAKQCNLTYQGLLPKINGEREFMVTEAWRIKQLLGLSNDEWYAIFFNNEVD
jgi:hypothetical protein